MEIDIKEKNVYTGIKLDDICKFTRAEVVRHGKAPYWICIHGFAINEDDMPQSIPQVASNHIYYIYI